jgi:hypothetical protein
LELDGGEPVANLRALARERLLVDVVGQPQVKIRSVSGARVRLSSKKCGPNNSGRILDAVLDSKAVRLIN